MSNQSPKRWNLSSRRCLRVMVIAQFLWIGLEIARLSFFPSAADMAADIVLDDWFESKGALFTLLYSLLILIVLVLNVISLVGLYLLKHWARWLYLSTLVTALAASSVSPKSLYDDWVAGGAWISSLLVLGLLISAFSPGDSSRTSPQG